MSVNQLPDGIVREVLGPELLVVVWAVSDVRKVTAVLEDTGHLALVVAPEETEDLLQTAGAPTLMLIETDLLDTTSSAVLKRIRARAPTLRICLLASAAASSAGLLTALRLGISESIDPDDDESLRSVLAVVHRPGERVLAIGAHPDDVEIACGATLLRHSALGHRVSVLTLSRGNVGGDKVRRTQEAVQCAVDLSAELFMADLVDTRLEEAHDMITLIEGVIAAVAPTTVYVHSSADNHQDHRAVHRSAVVAARRVPRLLCYQSPSSNNAFNPTQFIPVDDTIQDKVVLLRNYSTQSARHYLDPELVVATARYWARHVPQGRFVEPFEVLRSSESNDR